MYQEMSVAKKQRRSFPLPRKPIATPGPGKVETLEERVRRIYQARGGPIIGWLVDEARRRGHDMQMMSRELGVTYGYINQLRSGHRSTENLSQGVVDACARYLGVAPIVVKIVAGIVTMHDFSQQQESAEEQVERINRRLLDDPVVRAAVPVDIAHLDKDAKRALAFLYAESSATDVFDLRGLPDIVRWLQRAAVIHDESEGLALEAQRQAN